MFHALLALLERVLGDCPGSGLSVVSAATHRPNQEKPMFSAEFLMLVSHPLSALSALTMISFIPVIGALLVATIAADRTA
ncbi:hypothetical protein AA21291_1527 [Swaminathania salitolerans LMG 21291]|nr:hypothetical protein AA21291_1527 [Swaminathania salitolerans LMG 21291]